MTLPLWLWVILDALAAYRLTRLVTHDTFPPVQRVRDRVIVRYDGRWPAELITCPWCAGFWVSVLVTAATGLAPDPWLWVAAPLALSTVVGFISERE